MNKKPLYFFPDFFPVTRKWFRLILLCCCFTTNAQQLTFTFTNAGATGRLGPIQAQVTAAYALSNLSLVATTTPTSGIQTFTVPFTGPYRIIATGASGGSVNITCPANGGLGTCMQGEFNFVAGQVLNILVGQMGLSNGFDGGSGGGTFVATNLNAPLIVAGGGGGSTNNISQCGGGPRNGIDGSIGTSGTLGANGAGTGGANGSGGICTGGWGGAGGGFLTDGSGGFGGWGYSYLNGGFGGLNPNSFDSGGFGGGGAGWHIGGNGGGGGGYSGGGTSHTMPYSGGGGGGSYNAGINQVNTASCNSGHGRVVIIQLCYITAAGPPPICVGQSATLTTNAIANYSWSSGSTASFAVVAPTVTTTYSVQGQSTIGVNCMSSNFITVSVTPQLSLNLVASSPTACVGSSITLNGGVMGGIPAYTFTWAGGPAGNAYTISQPAGNYTHSLTVTDGNNCVLSRTVPVSFIANPVLSAPGTTLCLGSSVTLTAGGASTYTWNPSGFVGGNFSPSPSPTVTTVYTVTGRAASGCTASAAPTITLLPVPTLAFQTASITCASLGSATVTASGGTGPYSYTWNPTGQTAAAATGLTPGTYTLRVQDNSTGCVSTATTVFTSLIPLTGNLNNTPSVSCNGATTGTAGYTNLAGGSPVQNYFWNNGTSTSALSNPTTLPAGSWSITVTDALTGCILSNTFTITQPPALTLNLASGSATACVGTSVALSATISGGTPGYLLNWVGGPSGGSYTVSQALGGSYMYTLSGSDFYNCPISKTIGIGFVNNPVLSMTSVSICPFNMGTLTVSGANTYTWSNNNFGNIVFDNPLSTTQYTVWGSALGCSTAATASIVIKPPPVPGPVSNSPLCNQDSLQLGSNSGGISYTWSGPNGFSSVLQNPVINPVNLSHAGVYNLTVTAANTCTDAATTTLVVNPTPTISVSGSAVCTGQGNASLTALSLPGASYQWSGPLGFSSAQQNPLIITPGLTASGNYTVVVTSPAGCTNTALAFVNVLTPPSLSLTLSSTSLCAQGFNGSPNSIVLNASGGNTYNMITPADISNSVPSGPATSLSPLPPYTPGMVTATVIGSNGVCSSSSQISFYVIPNPIIAVSSPTTVLCAGQSQTLFVQGAAGYSWIPATTGLITYNLGSVAVANPSASSQFSVYGSSLGCNSASQSASLTVNALPVFTTGVSLATVCRNSSVLLSAGGTASSYTWSPAMGLSTVTGASVLASPLVNQQYTVTGMVNNCSATVLVMVNVLGLPSPQISAAKPSVCIYDTIALSGSGGLSYHWKGPYDLNMDGQSIRFRASNLASTGLYTLIVTDGNGCSNAATIPITVYEMPQAALHGQIRGCAPFCPQISLEHASPSSSLIITGWQSNLQEFQNNNFNLCLDVPGDHLLKASFKDAFTGCTNTQTFALTVLELPVADYTWEPKEPVEKVDQVQFTNTSRGEELQAWSWYFIRNNGPVSSRENPNLNFDQEGNYAIAMVVWNKNQCSDTIVKAITVRPDFNVFIPNSFTPNGDELNESFKPLMANYNGPYSLQVFNRWGQLLFKTNNINDGWNGKFLNEPCKEESYIYTIQIQLQNSETKLYKGYFTLVR